MAATIVMDTVLPSPRVLKITGDASYATGGYAIGTGGVTPDFFSQTTPPVGLNDGAAVIALVDAVNKKVKFITAATGAEVVNASNQSGTSVKVLLYN